MSYDRESPNIPSDIEINSYSHKKVTSSFESDYTLGNWVVL